jgi:hypothetical protein
MIHHSEDEYEYEDPYLRRQEQYQRRLEQLQVEIYDHENGQYDADGDEIFYEDESYSNHVEKPLSMVPSSHRGMQAQTKWLAMVLLAVIGCCTVLWIAVFVLPTTTKSTSTSSAHFSGGNPGIALPTPDGPLGQLRPLINAPSVEDVKAAVAAHNRLRDEQDLKRSPWTQFQPIIENQDEIMQFDDRPIDHDNFMTRIVGLLDPVAAKETVGSTEIDKLQQNDNSVGFNLDGLLAAVNEDDVPGGGVIPITTPTTTISVNTMPTTTTSPVLSPQPSPPTPSTPPNLPSHPSTISPRASPATPSQSSSSSSSSSVNSLDSSYDDSTSSNSVVASVSIPLATNPPTAWMNQSRLIIPTDSFTPGSGAGSGWFPNTSVTARLLPTVTRMKAPRRAWIVSNRRSGTHQLMDTIFNTLVGPIHIIKTNHVIADLTLGCTCLQWMRSQGVLVHAFRNPMDMLVSQFFYRNLFDPVAKNMTWAQWLPAFGPMYLADWRLTVTSWYAQPDVTHVEFDENTNDTRRVRHVLPAISRALGAPIREAQLLPFATWQKANKGIYGGKGVSGWRKMFTLDQMEWMDRELMTPLNTTTLLMGENACAPITNDDEWKSYLARDRLRTVAESVDIARIKAPRTCKWLLGPTGKHPLQNQWSRVQRPAYRPRPSQQSRTNAAAAVRAAAAAQAAARRKAAIPQPVSQKGPYGQPVVSAGKGLQQLKGPTPVVTPAPRRTTIPFVPPRQPTP